MTLTQATAPREIYLQISDDKEDGAEPFPTNLDGVTWCAESVLDCEVRYVRADLAPPAKSNQLSGISGQLNLMPDGMVMVPTEILDKFPEINPSNYDHDDACALNAWGVELVRAADNAALRARVKVLERLVFDAAYTLDKARIWNGMGWTYNPLHPIHYTPMRERLHNECDNIEAARAALEKP